jgi:hypothetical protein
VEADVPKQGDHLGVRVGFEIEKIVCGHAQPDKIGGNGVAGSTGVNVQRNRRLRKYRAGQKANSTNQGAKQVFQANAAVVV